MGRIKLSDSDSDSSTTSTTFMTAKTTTTSTSTAMTTPFPPVTSASSTVTSTTATFSTTSAFSTTFTFSTTPSSSTTPTNLFSVTPATFSPASSNSTTKKKVRTPEFKFGTYREGGLFLLPMTPWRRVEWTEEERGALVEKLSTYAPCSRDVVQARALLLGPVGSGKSSFISSVQSVFDGRVSTRAMVGQRQSSFTQRLQSFPLRASDRTLAVELCDSMGFGDSTGPSLQQLLSVVKGHAPEGYKFRAEQALSSDTDGYIKRPGLKEQMHCVAFVLDASKVSTSSYSKATSTMIQQLREHISDLDIHQVVLLTHVDKICKETERDTSEVYKSHVIRQTMYKAAELVGMSPSSVVPVRNYWCELDLNQNCDILLLRALELLLHYTDMYYRGQQRAKHEY